MEGADQDTVGVFTGERSSRDAQGEATRRPRQRLERGGAESQAPWTARAPGAEGQSRCGPATGSLQTSGLSVGREKMHLLSSGPSLWPPHLAAPGSSRRPATRSRRRAAPHSGHPHCPWNGKTGVRNEEGRPASRLTHGWVGLRPGPPLAPAQQAASFSHGYPW